MRPETAVLWGILAPIATGSAHGPVGFGGVLVGRRRSREQAQVPQSVGFLRRTPLWYYVLAEVATLEGGERLGPVGDTILAEVFVGLVRRGENSILRAQNREPTLPSEEPGKFTLTNFLRFAGVS